jgi:hypothetical protein
MALPGKREPQRGSTRWDVIRDALSSNARTARLCLIWLVMSSGPGVALLELAKHIRLQGQRSHAGSSEPGASPGVTTRAAS